MQNELESPVDGKVLSIKGTAGKSMDIDQPIVELEPVDEPEPAAS